MSDPLMSCIFAYAGKYPNLTVPGVRSKAIAVRNANAAIGNFTVISVKSWVLKRSKLLWLTWDVAQYVPSLELFSARDAMAQFTALRLVNVITGSSTHPIADGLPLVKRRQYPQRKLPQLQW